MGVMMKKIKPKWGKVIIGIVGLIAMVFLVSGIRYWDSVHVFNRSPERIVKVITEWIHPPRGNIYDRNGKQLTDYRVMYRLGVNLKQVESRETIGKVLSSVYGYDENVVMNAINIPYERYYAEYVELGSYFTREELSTIKKWKSLNPTQLASRMIDHEIQMDPVTKPSLKGLTWKAYKVRYYPFSSTASNVVGFYNFLSGTTGEGHFGVEGYYNDVLDSGADIHLTIDLDLQSQVESLLDKAVSASQAEGGSVVVMDANTGEIVVMASSERMDSNNYWTIFQNFSTIDPYNPIISSVYEPGSIFGIFSMAIALEERIIHPEDTFIDTGKIDIGGVTFTNPEQKNYGEITMAECLTLPSNVCLIWLVNQTGDTKYYDYLQKLGFDQSTNIDLEFENTYPLALPGNEQWYPATKAANAFGQGIAMSPIQLVTAASALTGHQNMVLPRVVSAIQTGSKKTTIPVQYKENPLSKETIQDLNQILLDINSANGGGFNIDVQSFVGIYGTGQVVGDYGEHIGYREDVFNQAFLGWGAAEEKQYIILFWMDNIPLEIKSNSEMDIFVNQILLEVTRK